MEQLQQHKYEWTGAKIAGISSMDWIGLDWIDYLSVVYVDVCVCVQPACAKFVCAF